MDPTAFPPKTRFYIEAECPHCEDGKQWASRYGGNDPDVWPVTCPHCGGSGVVEYDPADEIEDWMED